MVSYIDDDIGYIRAMTPVISLVLLEEKTKATKMSLLTFIFSVNYLEWIFIDVEILKKKIQYFVTLHKSLLDFMFYRFNGTCFTRRRATS